jgi:pimeloyl-ACP methyl ester carboxylesterase
MIFKFQDVKMKYSIISAIILLVSCAAKNITDEYNSLEIFNTDNGQYYLQRNESSKSLTIYIEGSGLNSVLGVADNGKFKSSTFSYEVLKFFGRTDSIVIPEKPNMKFGGDHHSDIKAIQSYTVESMATTYAESIDRHLSEFQYDEVVILGASEGGLLLPRIYSLLKNNEQVDALIVLGAGGLGQYECFQIQYEKYSELPEAYRTELEKLTDIKELIRQNPDSIEDGYLGWPYKRWSSFFEYTPIEYLRNISIPILFIQGVNDLSSPKESVEAVESLNLPNIDILYIDEMNHLPSNSKNVKSVFGIIQRWRFEI